MKCNVCGAEFSRGRFCPMCGTACADEVTQQPNMGGTAGQERTIAPNGSNIPPMAGTMPNAQSIPNNPNRMPNFNAMNTQQIPNGQNVQGIPYMPMTGGAAAAPQKKNLLPVILVLGIFVALLAGIIFLCCMVFGSLGKDGSKSPEAALDGFVDALNDGDAEEAVEYMYTEDFLEDLLETVTPDLLESIAGYDIDEDDWSYKKLNKEFRRALQEDVIDEMQEDHVQFKVSDVRESDDVNALQKKMLLAVLGEQVEDVTMLEAEMTVKQKGEDDETNSVNVFAYEYDGRWYVLPMNLF